MIRSIFLAGSALLFAASVGAPSHAALGGGEARMTGSGDNVSIERVGPAPSQAGRRTMFAGSSGDGLDITTLEQGPAAQPGRDLQLQGSREDANVTEAAPRPRS